MSIFSATYADYSNKVINEWKKLLREAFEQKDWQKMEQIIIKIEKYYFEE